MKVIFVLAMGLLSLSASAQWNTIFNTRLSDKLRISGKQCQGGEPSGIGHKNCSKGQWLLTFDDINYCQDNGVCTETFVFPFITELERIEIVSTKTMSFYRIKPKDRISLRNRLALSKYWVKFDLHDEPAVITKPKFY